MGRGFWVTRADEGSRRACSPACAAALRRHLIPWNGLQQRLVEGISAQRLTLKDVASATGVSRRTIGKWFAMKGRYLRSEGVARLAAYLDLEYATVDGTPLGLALTASATETLEGQTSDVRLTLDLDYAELGGAVAVAAPGHVWNRFTSTRYHYAIAYPGGFSVDTSQRGFDYLNGPSVTHVGGRRLTSHGRSLDSWSKTIINGHNAARLEYTLLSKQAHPLAGRGGLLLTSKYREHGQWLICYEVIAIRGSYVYDVFWISPLKTSAADLATWEQMLTTFAFS
jgi:transcriptional regulator with XRE-family HTH domain